MKITADPSGFEAGIKRAQEALAEGVEQMKASLESLNGAFETINLAAEAFTAVLAGGAAFKEAIQASIGAATGARSLGRELGITATQASILKVAMDENFVPMEAVSGAANKIAAAIKKNPEEFDRLGVAIRDSSGNMRNSFDIMTDVNEKLAELKEGTARNVEGQRIYGKAWETIAPSIRITEAAMEEAKEKAQSLHLIVGQEGIAQSTAYRKAMEGVHTVFEGIEKAIGDALIPALTSLGEWFTSIGPQAIDVIKGSIVALYAVFERLMAVGVTVTETLVGLWEGLAGSIQLVFEVMNAFLLKGPAGAKEAWDKNFKEIEDNAKQHAANIANAWKETSENIDQFAEKQVKQDTPDQEKTGKNTIEEDDAGKSRVGDWQTGLDEKKAAYAEEAAAEGQLREFSKQQEIEYWRSILQTVKATSEERKAIAAKIAADELAISKAQLEGSLEQLKNDESAHGANLAARLAADMKYAAEVARIHGAGSKEYAQAQKEITATLEAQVKQREEIAQIELQGARTQALQDVDNAEEAAKKKFDLMQINLQQLVALEKQYAAQRYAIHQEQLAQDLAILQQNPNYDPVKFAQIQQQVLQASSQYNQQLLKIDTQAAQQQIAVQKQLTSSMEQGFANAFSSVLKGSQTVGQAFTKMMQQMLSSVIDVVAKIIAQWAVQTATNLLLNRQQALANAGVAATGAMASAAAIPYVGFLLAPLEGAAVYASALGFAEKGWDIPAGVNPLAQLHQKEMVLPAKYAEPLRENLANGGGATGGGGSFHTHINAIDPHSFQRAMMKNGALEKAMRNLYRRGRYR
jgi:hypothetical protein